MEKLIAQAAWSPVLSFQSRWWFGCNVICWCWSIVFFENQRHCTRYQEILEHFMLPSADQLFKDADFIFQQDLAPAHTAKSTKSWLNDHVLVCLTASKLTRPEHRESLGYYQEKQKTKKCRWAEGHCQRNLGFHTFTFIHLADAFIQSDLQLRNTISDTL